MQRPLELCSWKDRETLPPVDKEYQQGYKRRQAGNFDEVPSADKVQHDSGLIQAHRNSQRRNDNVKLELQHLAAATPAGTSLVAIQRHVAVTLATWDAVWGKYLHPKWAEQMMRLYGAQEKVLERYFKLEEEAAIESQKRWPVLQACRKVVERPNSGRPTDRVKGKVVTVDEFRTSRVSSAMNSPQPCEEELDLSKPTRLEGWKPQPGTKAMEVKWLERWKHRGAPPAKSKEYPALGF
ncbi:hypothetical protein QJQ45_023432 [Haematococcus lacustris]|nr:hypothetical protein QJQ45_023432 [Haematococcus lacustris]